MTMCVQKCHTSLEHSFHLRYNIYRRTFEETLSREYFDLWCFSFVYLHMCTFNLRGLGSMET